ncbi:MAG: serine/threonine-protein phosphatase [Rhodocyclaceae bacterium]|nr:serine/threonine-protein phosphatase [Rhodocyclaceae bacterium]
MKFTIYQESRQGRRRNNEDRIAYCYSRDALLMVVADGMGGHYYGEVAAQIAAQTLTEAFQRAAKPALAEPFLFLQREMNNAHRAILGFAAAHRLDDSPRTTCVACVIQDNIAYWAHAGDSRLYLLRGGRLAAQTRDHSRVRALADQGAITEAQMAGHPDRHKVYSCLGGPQPPEIELSRKTPLETGDVLLLTTDGFWGPLPPDRIAAALHRSDPMQAVPALMKEAEERGGPYGDNLSVVAVRWEDNYVEPAQSTVSTKGMALDEVATRLDEFGRNPSYKLDLSDDEIEKAIEEIRSTIEKYSTKK